MSKSADQKLKLITLLQFFQKQTDEEHPASMAMILEHLEANGIQAERKSIYADVEALNRLGYYIEYTKENPSGYYLASRDFELAELKLLVDAVSSSKFITQKKSEEIIRKLESQTSKHRAQALQRQVYSTSRVKAVSEIVLYTIDSLHEAISRNRRISFHYCEWNRKKELVYRNDGKLYQVDPITLLWDDEYYYLVAYLNREGKSPSEYTEEDIRHFRVDKIRDLEIINEKRICSIKIDQFQPAEYAKEHFNMFSGTSDIVKLQFEEKLIGVMIDRFGKDISILPSDEGYLATRVRAQVSDVFFGWVSGFHGKIRIIGSDDVKEQYKQFIEDIRATL